MSDVDKSRNRILDDYSEDVYNNGLAFMGKEESRNLCKEILDDALVVVEELDKLRQEAKKRDEEDGSWEHIVPIGMGDLGRPSAEAVLGEFYWKVEVGERVVILSRAHDSLEISYRHAINDLGMLCNRARSEGIYNQLYNGLELHNHPDNFDDL